MELLYPNLLKDAVDAGHITRRQAYDFLLEHGVYLVCVEQLGRVLDRQRRGRRQQ